MAFGAILGAAASVGSSLLASSGAKKSAKAAAEEARLRRQTEQEMIGLAREQMGIGSQLLAREGMLVDWALDQNNYNRNQALDALYYGRDWTEQQRQQLMLEQQWELDRIRQLDSMYNQEYERRRAEIQANTRITASERERALAELERAQQIAQQERDFQIRLLEADRARLQDERSQALSYLDYNQRIAQAERDFDIQRVNQGQQYATSERAEALRWLEDSRSRAQQERDFDVEQLMQAQSQRQRERQFQEQEYFANRQQAFAEREDDLARRALIDDAATRLQAELEAAMSALGPMQSANLLGADDIAAEAARREQVAVDDMNAMADRVASINEGDLIRRGMDRSTTATAERSDMTARLATELAKARQQARSEAVQYVSGINDELKLGDELERLRRQQIVQEITSTYSPMVEALMRSPAARTALTGTQFSDLDSAVYERNLVSANDFSAPLQVGSGFYDRSIASAGNYSTPLSIGSAVLDRTLTSANDYRTPLTVNTAAYMSGDLGSGLYNQSRIGTSVAQIGPYSGSGVYSWNQPNMSSAASLYGSAGGILGNVLSSQGSAANAAATRAGNAAGAAGQAWGNTFSRIEDLAKDIFKKS